MATLASESERTAAQPVNWLRGRWGAVGIIAALYSAVHVCWTYTHWGGEEYQAAISNLAFLPISLLAALAAFRIWTQPGVDRSIRLAWGLLGLGLLANFFGDLLWFYYETILQSAPFPSWADLGYLAFYPLVMAALLNFPYSPVSRSDQQRLYLDSAVVLVASWMAIWYFILAPSVDGLSLTFESVLVVAYPLADLVIVYGLIIFLFRHPNASIRSGFGFLLAAMLLFVVADVIYSIQGLNDTYVSGDPIDNFWLLSYLCFIFAALEQCANLQIHGSRFKAARQVNYWWLLPYVMLAAGYALAIWAFAVSTGIDSRVRGLFGGAVALTVLISWRQVLELRENRRLNKELLLRLQQLDEAGLALNRAEYLASIGTLAAGVAHELNNPLGVIVASQEVLMRRSLSGDWQKEVFLNNLNRIERSAWYGAKIVRSLLTYARGGELALTRATARALIDDALLLVHLPPDAGVELKTNVAPDTPAIICDQDKIAQVLVNLIDNALDAMTSPGTITLNASRHSDGGLVLKVTDTGAGMSDEVLAHAFDPFYTTKPTGEGTGLGLSICRGIVRAHDGQMKIDSRPGQGTQVTITLPPEPLAHPAVAKAAATQPSRTQTPPY
jgi:signal transduction histidine kinase